MGRFLVGLTGGLASGKSTVAGRLADAGFRVLDADEIVAELYRPGGGGAAAVRELFGGGVLAAGGGVDRPRLAEVVFADAEARRRLEAAIHPLVRERFREIAAEADGVVVYEATLLVEAGRAGEFDLVVSVESPPAAQLERAVVRGMDADAARARLAAQGDGELRRRGAHRILWNDGTLEELRVKVDALVAELRQRAGSAG
ncbi:MAG TPA: dephospho-CoA kinase [Thermoanaerobaculia bacterium]